jgi:hypothetical protein
LSTITPFQDHQPTMPRQNCLWPDDARHLRQQLPAECPPFTANRQRCSSVSRSRLPLSCDFKISFSVLRYSIAACCCRLNQPANTIIRKYFGHWIVISLLCRQTAHHSTHARIEFYTSRGKPTVALGRPFLDKAGGHQLLQAFLRHLSFTVKMNAANLRGRHALRFK